jgi:hypothetical protein
MIAVIDDDVDVQQLLECTRLVEASAGFLNALRQTELYPANIPDERIDARGPPFGFVELPRKEAT